MAKANLAAQKALYQANCSDPEPPPKKLCPDPIFVGVDPRVMAGGGAALVAGGLAVVGALGVGSAALVLAP